ncbi:MAG: type I glutamate--ammonia ligase [Deltaproteobacteria bacterium]|nr:type I glutamate--ammonia ligase [Deltaproteobacteria bacterium]
MAATTDKIIRILSKENILSIDLKFVDMNGEFRKVTISRDEFNDDLLKYGIGFDGSSVTGFRKVKAGDLVLIPDIDTMHFDPVTETKVLSFLCSINEADSRKQFEDDPRYICKKAGNYLRASKIADEAFFAPEYEFYIFNNVSYDISKNHSFFFANSEEGYWNSEFGEGKYLPIPYQRGYHKALPADRYFYIRDRIIRTMHSMDIKFKYHHHEVASPSQHEIEVPPTPLLKAADNTVWIKYIVKNVCKKESMLATFMPKPLPEDSGTGLHIHILLKKDGKNIFYGSEYASLSKTALFFIGGILYHGRALAAFTNPSVNSYKRLVPGFEAPTTLVFSLGNRSAAIRIPKYATTEKSARFEFRTPDATANPYLAFAAVLMAGIDGIKNKIDPVKNGYGPFDKNLYELTDAELKKINSIPHNFEEALASLQMDYEFLLSGGVFTKNFIDAWVNTKFKEAKQFRYSIDPLEYKIYFDC